METKYQIVKIMVPESGATVKFSADSYKTHKSIEALFMSLPEDKAVVGTTLGLKIADKEIFPDEYEAKLICTNLNVSPNARFYERISEEANGSRIDGRYKDSGKADVYPYVAKLYLRLEEKV